MILSPTNGVHWSLTASVSTQRTFSGRFLKSKFKGADFFFFEPDFSGRCKRNYATCLRRNKKYKYIMQRMRECLTCYLPKTQPNVVNSHCHWHRHQHRHQIVSCLAYSLFEENTPPLLLTWICGLILVQCNTAQHRESIWLLTLRKNWYFLQTDTNSLRSRCMKIEYPTPRRKKNWEMKSKKKKKKAGKNDSVFDTEELATKWK